MEGVVIAAGVFSILSVGYLLSGSPGPVSGPATSPSALPADPASELRLADYQARVMRRWRSLAPARAAKKW
jgi:hypothetical protein